MIKPARIWEATKAEGERPRRPSYAANITAFEELADETLNPDDREFWLEMAAIERREQRKACLTLGAVYVAFALVVFGLALVIVQMVGW